MADGQRELHKFLAKRNETVPPNPTNNYHRFINAYVFVASIDAKMLSRKVRRFDGSRQVRCSSRCIEIVLIKCQR